MGTRLARLLPARAAAPAALAALVLAGFHPLLGGRLLLGHDAERYLPRVVEMNEALRHGEVPPLWAASLSHGHGQPLFQFAPPLLYLVGAPVHALGLGLARAVQLPVLLALAGGALCLHLLVRPVAGDAGGLAAAAAFLFSPWLQVEVYVRAAWAEALALALLPALLLAAVAAARRPGVPRVLALAAATAAIALAHPPGLLMALGVAALLVPAAALAQRSGAALVAGASGVALGLALSAFWWLPAVAERDLVKTGLLIAGAEYRDHFLAPAQLVWSRWGFGHSHPGPDGMPFHLGPIQLALGALGAWRAWRSRERAVRWLAGAALAALAGSLLLVLPVSEPAWRTLPLLDYFLYPWRLLAVACVMLAPLAGLALRGASGRAAGAVILLLVAVNIRHAGAWGSRAVEPHEADPEAIALRGTKTSLHEEYEPRGAAAGLPYQREPLVPLRIGAQRVDVEVRVVERRPARQRYEVRAEQRVRLAARTFDYPGWTVRVDGARVAHEAEARTGRIAFELEPGRHEVVLELEPTPVRRAARAASAAALVAATGLLVLRPLGRRPRRAPPAHGATRADR